MSTPNQKSIKSFFQAPKRSKSSLESEEVQDTTNNSRPFKFARVSTPTLNNMDQDDFDIDEDSDDINDNDIQLVSVSFSDKEDSPQPFQNPKSQRVFLWKDEYQELFKWLKYDPARNKAWCSYSSCQMYTICL